MTTTLARLLDGRMPDPDGPGMLSVPIRHVVIAPTLAGGEADLVGRLGFGRRIGIVSDVRTRAVLAERIETALSPHHDLRMIVIEGEPHPDQDTVARVMAWVQGCDALIAVGSGTINDITKYAAFQAEMPFAVFGTAPSMNGYTSVSAAITVGGHKKSLPARTPIGVFLDLGVLARAPERLVRAGFGDSICRATAQVDWLMAHRLRGEPYRTAPYALLAEDEAGLIANPAALLTGDLVAMERLARTLILSGLGMTICGNSKPASQGEHLLSHYVEMMAMPDLPHALHGEQIAVTTLAMARLQARMINGPAPVLTATRPNALSLEAHFGSSIGASCWADFAGKRLNEAEAFEMTTRMRGLWPDLTSELRDCGRPAAEIEAALLALGAPTHPRDLGWPNGLTRDAMVHAREIRDRYTFLDLGGDAGLLDEQANAWVR